MHAVSWAELGRPEFAAVRYLTLYIYVFILFKGACARIMVRYSLLGLDGHRRQYRCCDHGIPDRNTTAENTSVWLTASTHKRVLDHTDIVDDARCFDEHRLASS